MRISFISQEVCRTALAMGALLALLTMSGCGSSTPTVKAKDVDASDDALAAEYEIGPGDGLQIFVWDHADLSARRLQGVEGLQGGVQRPQVEAA